MPRAALPTPTRRVLRADEAAQYLGYPDASAAFYNYCEKIGIRPIENRSGAYDRVLIDRRLDAISGVEAAARPRGEYEGVEYGNA